MDCKDIDKISIICISIFFYFIINALFKLNKLETRYPKYLYLYNNILETSYLIKA